MLSGMAPDTARQMLAGNIGAAMGRTRLTQTDLAERMKQLGYEKWSRQTVAEIVSGNRRVLAEELFGLALCLDAAVDRLMRPLWEQEDIELTSGFALPALAVGQLVGGGDFGDEPAERVARLREFRRGIRWDGNVLVRVPSRFDNPAQG
jgi:transcriptional regulator with XRE-family HTH domain